MHKKSVLIWNITFVLDSSLANAGDKALLHSIVGSFRGSESSKNIDLAILVHEKEFINKYYPSIRCNETKGLINKLRVFAYIKKCDYFVFGGGEGFQNVSSSIFLFLNLLPGYIALLLGKKIICYGSGVGQEFELVGLGKYLTGFLLRRAKLITLRDNKSAEALISMKVNPEIVHAGADPALLIDKRDINEEIKRYGARTGLRQKTICIAPRLLHFYTNKNIIEKICSLLPIDTRIRFRLIPQRFFKRKSKLVADLAYIADDLIKKFHREIVFLPMYSGRISPHDEVLCAEIKAKMKYGDHATIAKSDLTIFRIIEILKECDLAIAMPLHTLILSALYGTPIIAINYQTKGQRFMDSIGQRKNSFYLRDILQKIPKKEILDRARTILAEPVKIRSELKGYVTREQKRAEQNFHLVENYIAPHEKK